MKTIAETYNVKTSIVTYKGHKIEVYDAGIQDFSWIVYDKDGSVMKKSLDDSRTFGTISNAKSDAKMFINH